MNTFQKSVLVCLLLLGSVVAPTKEAHAGMEVNLEQQYHRLQQIDERVRDMPESQEVDAIRIRIRELQEELLRNSPGPEMEWKIRDIEAQISLSEQRMRELQERITDFREHAANDDGDALYPNAQNRLAVFTYDDPHGVGLGNAVSFLLSKSILFSATVPSFAVVDYQSGVESKEVGGIAYFDKVEFVSRNQGYLLQIWGRISRTDSGDIIIDSFLQLPDSFPNETQLLKLPAAMGGGELKVRLSADRIRVQTLRISDSEGESLREATQMVAALRTMPSINAPLIGNLVEGSFNRPYFISNRSQEWVKLAIEGDVSGWTSVSIFCKEQCRKLSDVGSYANALVAVARGQRSMEMPEQITQEARILASHLAAKRAVKYDPSYALKILGSVRNTDGAPEAFGATDNANIGAIAAVANALLKANAEQEYDAIRLSPGMIEEIADRLAQASVEDPGDLTTVENLTVLFRAIGDDKREALAAQIATSLKLAQTLNKP